MLAAALLRLAIVPGEDLPRPWAGAPAVAGVEAVQAGHLSEPAGGIMAAETDDERDDSDSLSPPPPVLPGLEVRARFRANRPALPAGLQHRPGLPPPRPA